MSSKINFKKNMVAYSLAEDYLHDSWKKNKKLICTFVYIVFLIVYLLCNIPFMKYTYSTFEFTSNAKHIKVVPQNVTIQEYDEKMIDKICLFLPKTYYEISVLMEEQPGMDTIKKVNVLSYNKHIDKYNGMTIGAFINDNGNLMLNSDVVLFYINFVTFFCSCPLIFYFIMFVFYKSKLMNLCFNCFLKHATQKQVEFLSNCQTKRMLKEIKK